jgi:hypothetical protein
MRLGQPCYHVDMQDDWEVAHSYMIVAFRKEGPPQPALRRAVCGHQHFDEHQIIMLDGADGVQAVGGVAMPDSGTFVDPADHGMLDMEGWRGSGNHKRGRPLGDGDRVGGHQVKGASSREPKHQRKQVTYDEDALFDS